MNPLNVIQHSPHADIELLDLFFILQMRTGRDNNSLAFSLFFLNIHSSASHFETRQWPSSRATKYLYGFCVHVLMGKCIITNLFINATNELSQGKRGELAQGERSELFQGK